MRPRRPLDPYWMMAPTALLLALFFFYPLLNAAYLSLYQWDLLTPPKYVGLDNYAALSQSGELMHAFTTTLAFSVVVVVGSMVLGLGMALALNRPGPFAAFVRGAVFSAYVVSWVSVALLFLWVLDADAGIFSAALRGLGLPTKNWLGDPHVALYTLAGVTIWKIAGYSMVLFVAGLQDIPGSLYEAAALDGAGRVQRFVNVTWPLLRPTTAFVGTTSLIVSFQVFDVVRVMTQGGPVRSTTVFVYAIYEQVFLNLRVGRANALVVVFFGLLLVLTVLQLLAWRRKGAA
ncbi:MAG: sugar ABC transporter permease [Myxococcales bacterium]|nr:sugar ABC transporter permease [Myxococcales bacterium]MCB9580948.1 sugar ABC transporter permease [Polyangiaceae bacterium]